MRILHLTLIAYALVLALGSGAAALETGAKAPAFKLADQFGKTWDLAALKGQVVVLIVADRDSGRMMDPWMSGLKDKYGSKIQLLGLLDLHTVPWIGRGIAKSRIKNETKDPLMIDFNGATGKAYGVSGKHPVVVVIDKTGDIQNVATTYSDEAFKAATAAVDKALK